MTIFIVFTLIVIMSVVYLSLPGSGLYRQYHDEVNRSFHETDRSQTDAVFSHDAIEQLPEPIRNYIAYCGYLDTPVMDHMYADFTEADFVISPGDSPIKIRYEQYNFVTRPDRHAFIHAKMYGIPLSGKDSVIDGEGSMTIKLAKHFTVGYTEGDEMSQAQLVTALADAILMPSLFLQDYVTWELIDKTHVKATLTWGGVSASGVYTLNEVGEIIRFDTDDRYYDTGSEMVPRTWTIEYNDYQEKDGFRRPSSVRVFWHMDDRSEYTYFESHDYTVSFAAQ